MYVRICNTRESHVVKHFRSSDRVKEVNPLTSHPLLTFDPVPAISGDRVKVDC